MSKTLSDFSAEFEIAVYAQLPKNWTEKLTDTQMVGTQVVPFHRAANSIAHQVYKKKAGLIGWAVNMYIKDCATPLGQHLVASTWIYVDNTGKMLNL